MEPAKIRKWSRRCFYLMWIPVATFMIGMMGMPEGEYSFSELPPLARYSVIPAAVLFVGAMAGLVGASLFGGGRRRALLKNGQPAVAEILNRYETGTRINRSPVVGFELEVRPPGAPSFAATTEQLVSLLDLHHYEVGAEINVKYDPDTRAVAIVPIHQPKPQPLEVKS